MMAILNQKFAVAVVIGARSPFLEKLQIAI